MKGKLAEAGRKVLGAGLGLMPRPAAHPPSGPGAKGGVQSGGESEPPAGLAWSTGGAGRGAKPGSMQRGMQPEAAKCMHACMHGGRVLPRKVGAGRGCSEHAQAPRPPPWPSLQPTRHWLLLLHLPRRAGVVEPGQDVAHLVLRQGGQKGQRWAVSAPLSLWVLPAAECWTWTLQRNKE